MKLRVYEPGHEIETSREALRESVAVIERAGRTCYKSEDKIDEGTAETFIRGIVRRGHESVIEHGHATVRIIGDRAMTHQLVRHRLCEYSQESQRYCDYGSRGFGIVCQKSIGIIPPGEYEKRDGEWHHLEKDETLFQLCGNDNDRYIKMKFWLDHVASSYNVYLQLRDNNIKPEDARSVLPNCTKTEIVMTANYRVWRHLFNHRALNPHAQWQIRGIMLGILKEFAEIVPEVFGDMIEKSE